MSVSPVDPATLAEAETAGDRPEAGVGFVGRSSPGQLARARLRRDRTGLGQRRACSSSCWWRSPSR